MATIRQFLEYLSDGALRSSGEIVDAGFTRDMIRRAALTGEVNEIARGVYQIGNPVEIDAYSEVATAWYLNKSSFVSYSTAAALHGMTDDIVSSVEITLPFGKHISKRGDGTPINGHWTRSDAGLSIGVVPMKISGVTIQVTDPHRTFLDIVSHKDLKATELCAKVLVSYVQDHHDVRVLNRHAEHLGISSTIFEARIRDTQQAFEIGSVARTM